ncbi:MAG: hypothetical protein EOR22_06500 [Mesorhizobium sp.]|nr:MAG: hypothetical protein EOR22_06500 [Mesorhizobium sp.]
MSSLIATIEAYADARVLAADGRRAWKNDDSVTQRRADLMDALRRSVEGADAQDRELAEELQRTLSTAVALVDKHINAAVRCKDEAIYKNGVPMGIVIQDYRELRESIAALGDNIEPWVPEPPAGWFLNRAAHEHTPIIFNGDTHKPQPHVEGPWLVEFQRLPHGGRLTEGRGRTFGEAWNNACAAVARKEAA